MKKLLRACKVRVAFAIAVTLTFFMVAVQTVSAGKPSEVVGWSNGFPSGPHFNLNIHGKNNDYICTPEPGGGSVFVPEYGDSEIQIIQNKKSSISELTVHDKCAEAFDGDPVQVQLPAGHYQVYARIIAKPAKPNEPRDVSFSPKLVDACNDTTVYDLNGDGAVDVSDLSLLDTNGDGNIDEFDDPDFNGDGVADQLDVDMWTSTFGELIECTDSTLIGLGIVTGSGAFTKDNQPLSRTTGKNKAVNVTEMFMYSGLVFDTSLDLNGDGDLTLDDLTSDLDGDSDIDSDDFELWITELVASGLVIDSRTDPMYIFDIADLVVYGWDYKNNGSKLVQIRFYSDDQTEYIID
jgi:hypothetical protein